MIIRTARRATGEVMTLQRSGNLWSAADSHGRVWHQAEWGTLADITLALGWEGWTVTSTKSKHVPVKVVQRKSLPTFQRLFTDFVQGA